MAGAADNVPGMRCRLVRFGLPLVATTVAAVAPRARAGPPMLTDDPWTRPAGQTEINIAYVPTLTRQTSVTQAPFFNPNYNITDNVQVNYFGAWVVDEQDDKGTHSGLGDPLVNVKWRFIDQDQAGFAMSVAPRLEFNNTAAAVRHGLGNSGTVLTLPVEVGRTVGPYTVFAEAGYQFVQFTRDTMFLGVCGAYQVTDRVQLLAELFTIADTSFDDVEPIANVGTSITLTDYVNAQFSIGRSLRDTPTSPWLVMYAGLQFHF